jgi:hypothetical protein
MLKTFGKSLHNLKNGTVRVSVTSPQSEPGKASIQLLFANGTTLRADYWRVIEEGTAGLGSFDHQQPYGLPAPLDALEKAREQLQHKTVTDAQLYS